MISALRTLILLAVMSALSGAAGCNRSPKAPAPPSVDAADIIYVGGDIVTIDDAQPAAEALAVKDGRIVAVGARADVEKAHNGATTRIVDLRGRTLTPGFIDSHSHYYNSLLVANHEHRVDHEEVAVADVLG